MSKASAVRGGGWGVFVVVAVLMVRPGPAAAVVNPCTDNAWAGYNACLVGARSEFGMMLCDLWFGVELIYCAARSVE